MLWRLWTAFAGAPLGLLAALAVLAEPSVWALEASAAAGAGLLAVLLSLVARQRDDDPTDALFRVERGARAPALAGRD